MKINVLVASFNCNQLPPTGELLPWFYNDHGVLSFELDSIDLFVFNLQELTTVDNVSKEPKPTDYTNAKIWTENLLSFLNSHLKTPVSTVFSECLGGTETICFVKSELLANKQIAIDPLVIECSRSKTTIKGCVSFQCKITDNENKTYSLAFAGVHLSADQESDGYKDRVRDLKKVTSSTFKDNSLLENQDFICIFGDLNFRIYMERDKIVSLLNEKKFDQIFPFDQLTKARKEENVLVGFQEGVVTFPPTYKYVRGKTDYNLTEPLNKLSPAYTDRVVFKGSNRLIVTQTNYNHGYLYQSDHRPIFSTFFLSEPPIPWIGGTHLF